MTDMVQAEATELNPEKTHDSRLSIGQQQATIPSMPDGERKQRRVAGAMTGTSLDGIDTALVSIEGRGTSMTAKLVRHASQPYGEIAEPLRDAATQTPMSAATFVELARELGLIHVDTIKLLLGSSERADLIAVHGQTIYHAPPMSWQLIDPGPVAAAFECPVVYDLRAADLEAGGQGAPITPLADWIMFRHPERSRAIVNLGGFCNVTILPAGTSDDAIGGIRGFDVCVCNQLLDMVAREKLGQAYDDRGLAAAVGRTDRQSGVELYDLLARQRSAGRSLGTGDEAIAWVHAHKYRVDGHDLASTATEAVACCIAEVLAPHEPDDIIVAGGGSLNQTLTGGIGEFAGARTRLSGDLGVPIDSREAMAIAILGAMCEDGVPITLPAVTGCRLPAPVAGRWVGRTQRESPAASGSDPSRTSA